MFNVYVLVVISFIADILFYLDLRKLSGGPTAAPAPGARCTPGPSGPRCSGSQGEPATRLTMLV